MGFAVGSSCLRAPEAAAQAYCASVQGVTSSGVVSCQAPSHVGGQVFAADLVFESAASAVTRSIEVELPECEPFDMAGAGPLLWMALAGSVAILSLRRLAVMFQRETL
jgi:hypothetical protein